MKVNELLFNSTCKNKQIGTEREKNQKKEKNKLDAFLTWVGSIS